MYWREFLDTCSRLGQGAIEGDWRSAVSRGYYAVFHYFREWLLAQKLDLGQGGQSHFNLYVGLNNCGIPDIHRLVGRIDALRSDRVWADYNLATLLSKAQALLAFQEAGDIVAEFQAILATTSPAQIVTGVRKHLQAIGKLGKTP